MFTHCEWQAKAAALRFRNQTWINGAFMLAASGARLETINPASGQVITDVARGAAIDIDCAVAAARAGFCDGRWSHQTPAQRKEVLLRLTSMQ